MCSITRIALPTTDALYEPYQTQVDRVLCMKGYTQGEDWLTLKFEGAEHSERAWRERVHISLEFLLGGPVGAGATS
jgi:hypothetical protein